MSLNHSPSPRDNIFSWVFTRRSAIGKALAFSAPVVVFVLVVTSFTGGVADTSMRMQPFPTSAVTTTQAQSRVEVADAQQRRSGQTTAVTPTMPELAPSAKPTPPPLVGEMATYTVVAGDIPLTIAQKLNVPGDQRLDWAHQLLTLNDMTSTELQVGQVLKLPANTPFNDSPKPVEPTATNTSAPPSVPSPG